MIKPHRTLFVYWGRRGGVSRFALDVWRAAQAEPLLDAMISVSRQNETFEEFATTSARLIPINTFTSNAGAILNLRSLPSQRTMLRERLQQDGIESVVLLLSHVWTPFFYSAFREAGARIVTIVHDADPHPGDPAGRLQAWYQRDLNRSDRIVTLSRSVTHRLVEEHGIDADRILTLFHPDFAPTVDTAPHSLCPPAASEPLRLLFLGRILPYKDLNLLIEAVKHIRALGRSVTLGVFGEGDLSPYRTALNELDAEIANRWLSEKEIDQAVAGYHALALSHSEASQSGVAGLAFGKGLPVVARPTGGLVEQVIDGVTGIVARDGTAKSFAKAALRLVDEPGLYETIVTNLQRGKAERSMVAFLAALARDLQSRASPS